MNSPSTSTKEKQSTRVKMKKPSKYHVIFHNDDKTPMHYVTFLLMQIFGHSEAESNNIMLKVHNEGKASAGVYIKEIAIMKQKTVEGYNQSNGVSLVTTLEPET